MERGRAHRGLVLGLVALAASAAWRLQREPEPSAQGLSQSLEESGARVEPTELEPSTSAAAREPSPVVASATPRSSTPTGIPGPVPRTATVRVRVVPPAGTALSAAVRAESDVHVHGSPGQRYSLPEDVVVVLREVEVESGTRAISCRVPGFIQRLEPVELTPYIETELTIELDQGNRIRGRVEDEAGVPLEVGVYAMSGGVNQVYGTTDALGRFELSGIAPGRTRVSARTRHYLGDASELGELSPGTEIDGLLFVLRRGESIGGHVFLPDGRPAVGAEVEAESVEHESEWTRTTEDGSFLMQGLSKEFFHVRAWVQLDLNEDDEYERPADDWLRPRVQVSSVPSGTRDLELRLEVPPELEVEIVNGAWSWMEMWNLDGTRAWPAPRDEWSEDPSWEAEGRTPRAFVLRGLPRGDYWLQVANVNGKTAFVRLERESFDDRVLASLSQGTWIQLPDHARLHGETGLVLRRDGSPSFGEFLLPPGTHRAEWDEGGTRRELTFTVAGEETFDLAAEIERLERSPR